MIVIDLIGPAGCGKSTTVFGLLYIMKRLGLKVEYASEYAKDMVYEERGNILQDQLYILAKQNRKLSRLAKAGIDYAVTDTSLLLGNVYSRPEDLPELKAVINAYYNQYDNRTFFLPVNENFTFQTEGRVQQSREESAAYLQKIEEVLPGGTIRLAMSDDYVWPILMRLGLDDAARKLKYTWGTQLADFGGDEELAAEYSTVYGCPKADAGYHCSCYDRGEECCLCEEARRCNCPLDESCTCHG